MKMGGIKMGKKTHLYRFNDITGGDYFKKKAGIDYLNFKVQLIEKENLIFKLQKEVKELKELVSNAETNLYTEWV